MEYSHLVDYRQFSKCNVTCLRYGSSICNLLYILWNYWDILSLKHFISCILQQLFEQSELRSRIILRQMKESFNLTLSSFQKKRGRKTQIKRMLSPDSLNFRSSESKWNSKKWYLRIDFNFRLKEERLCNSRWFHLVIWRSSRNAIS